MPVCGVSTGVDARLAGGAGLAATVCVDLDVEEYSAGRGMMSVWGVAVQAGTQTGVRPVGALAVAVGADLDLDGGAGMSGSANVEECDAG